MTSNYPHLIVRLLLLVFLVLHATLIQAAPRVALLVGNAAYADAPLTNPPNDVMTVAQALKDVGFEVRTLINAGEKEISRAIRDFGRASLGVEIALFYYSGHGMQSRGENYLIPVGAEIQHENDLLTEAVSANQVLRWIEEAAPKAAVVILDACRDNPIVVKSKSGTKGLSRMDAPTGALVAYATAPGATAGDDGHYAQSLANYLRQPGLVLEDVFDRVGADVARRTRNKQLPRLEDSLYEKVYLVPIGGSAQAANTVSFPVQTGMNLEDLKRQQDVREQWRTWQVRMNTDFREVSNLIAASTLKAMAWQRFLASYVQDNPFSEEDERLRAKAQQASKLLAVELDMSGRVRAAPQAGRSFRDCPACPEMVWIPPGRFIMGSEEPDSNVFTERPGARLYDDGRYSLGLEDGDADEGPRHVVHIAHFLAVAKYEVTVGEFRRFVDASGYTPTGCTRWFGNAWQRDSTSDWNSPGHELSDTHPVVCVSWDDAQRYLQWLNERTGKIYRLLSEAEWEYVARAGSVGEWPWSKSGDSSCRHANIADQAARDKVKGASNWVVAKCRDGYGYTAPVGGFPANAFGLHDMAGNVWEWVEDCWHEGYEGAPINGEARSSGDCGLRVLRGASWIDQPDDARVANRTSGVPGGRYDYVGFRIASE